MQINYNNFEFVEFGGYVIDHEFNKKLLNTLEQFSLLTQQVNLNYYLAGSIALAFVSNKIYRTWKDIDIVIEKDAIHDWVRKFPKKEWYYYDINKKSMKIYHSYNKNYIELNTVEESLFYYHKKHLNIINMYGLNIGNPKTTFFWKKNIRKFDSKKDMDDELFYKEYLNV